VPAPPLIKRRERTIALAVFLTLLLIFTAANAPFAVSRIHSRTAPRAPRVLLLHDDTVGDRNWPASTPHDEPWPSPDYISLEREFGYSHYHVRGESPDSRGFSMELERMGWPFAVLEEKRMWWDWDDPALDGPEPDPRMYVKPLGLILNPIILAGIPILVLFGPPALAVVVMRARRRRRGRCVYCAYPLDGVTICPECGTDHPT